MPFVAAPNIVMWEYRGQKDGRNVENRIHVNVFHAPTDADLIAIATALNPLVLTEWLPLLPSDFVMRETHARSLHTANGVERTFAFSPTNVGTFTGPPMPNLNTICASLRSTSSGRSARGRLYWMGLTESNVAGNTVDGTFMNSVQTALRNVRNALTSASFQWQIVSYVSGGIPRPGGPVYFPVSDIVFVDNVVDSQRGRMQ